MATRLDKLTPTERRGLLILLRPHLRARAHVEASLERTFRTHRPTRRQVTLTPAEQRVLDLFAAGHDVRTVAAELGIAASTVKEHTKHAREKLGVSTTREAVELACSHDPHWR